MVFTRLRKQKAQGTGGPISIWSSAGGITMAGIHIMTCIELIHLIFRSLYYGYYY
jgi:hypothetical protein